MSDQKDPREQNFSLDDILAEYGTGKYTDPKVVEFPEQEPAPPAPGPDPVVFPQKSAESPAEHSEDEPLAEIEPVSILHGLAARLHTLQRRADHYADHMYDQAEPDEETLRAERYIPGVDREEPQRAPRQRRKPQAARQRTVPPDVPPAELSARYAHGLKSMRLRVALAMICAVLSTLVSLDLPAVFDWGAAVSAGMLPMPVLRRILLLSLLLAAGGLCFEVIGRGLGGLFRLRPGAETLPAFAFLFTLADSIALLLTDWRAGLPCCAVTCFCLAFSQWGLYAHRGGDRLSARAAAQAKAPFAVTLDEEKWSGRPAYVKWPATQAGFGSQLQTPDGLSAAYRVAAPVLLTCCIVCAGLTAAAQQQGCAFFWTASVMLTAASPWSMMLIYAIPYRKLARRLFDVGAALAGWPGTARCREAGILMTDNDLFPTGSVRVSGVKVFGDFPDEKVVAYTATMLRALDCGLTRPFHDLLRAQGAFYREVSGVRHHEGGISGIIRNQEVLVGTASFMHLMDIDLPQGLNVKHAVFCAISGDLAGIFALNYAMSPAVKPCLTALMANGTSPVLVTRDPNLIPSLLGQKFKLPVDKMEFPPVDRRLELSGREQEHDETLVALLSREGLGPYCDAVVGGRRLRAAVRAGTAIVLAAGVIGAALTFYLTYVGAESSLTTVNFLLFMGLWLVPAWLLTNWVNQY